MSDQVLCSTNLCWRANYCTCSAKLEKNLHPLLFPPERARIAPFRGWLTTLHSNLSSLPRLCQFARATERADGFRSHVYWMSIECQLNCALPPGQRVHF